MQERNGYTLMSSKKSQEQVIHEFKENHGNKFDYSEVVYEGTNNKVSIICPIHGKFYQTPREHIKRSFGCRECSIEYARTKTTISTEDYINSIDINHRNLYDLSKVKYVRNKKKIIVICPKHGEFTISAAVFKNGGGCTKCQYEKLSNLNRDSESSFIEKSKLLFGKDYFNYWPMQYGKNGLDYIYLWCNKHSKLVKTKPQYHLQGNNSCRSCRSCSMFELTIKNFLDEHNIEYIENDKRLLHPKEIDIVIPDHNIGIECDGIYWHGESKGKYKKYHLEKTLSANNNNYRLIHIFENEIINNEELVKSRLSVILKLSNIKKYGARELRVDYVDKQLCVDFLNENHIQKSSSSSIDIALFRETEIIAVMTFGMARYSQRHEYELIRFCCKKFVTVSGGASKLFKYFIKNHNPKSIVSYSDIRWNTGKLYKNLGFLETHKSAPNYKYFCKPDIYNLLSRVSFQKHKLKSKLLHYDEKLTEWENMQANGYDRIWDCGNIVFEWLQPVKDNDII